MTMQMDDTYASALREALIDHVQTAPARRRRAARRLALGAAAGPLLVAAGAAAAAATDILRLPGSPDVVPLAPTVTVTVRGPRRWSWAHRRPARRQPRSGSARLTPGTFLTADGASLVGANASSAGTGAMGWHLAVVTGQHSTVITAGAG